MSEFEKSSERLRKHTFGLKSLIDNPQLRRLLNKSGALGQTLIEMHNIQGRYLGGKFANRGYSTKDLPVFFFGQGIYNPENKTITLNAPRFNINNILISSDKLRWITTQDGRRTAILKGGYSQFLRLTRPGKNLSKVDHTFTGGMLRNLTFDFTITTKSGQVRFFVRPPHDDKARWTHNKRQWMGFFEDDIRKVREMAIDEFGLILVEELSTE